MHITFPLVVMWMAYVYYQARGSVGDALQGVLLVLSVFCIVVMHELGHALTARRFGIGTRDIILLPIGGVARLERIPEEPRQELLIAVAGPAVNVVLAVIFFVLHSVFSSGRDTGYALGAGSDFLNSMFWVNITLILFNALPAFPMDGGRVLRALLAMRLNYARATTIAAAVGKVFAVIFGIAGLMLNAPALIVIAFFVWIGASGEASLAQFRYEIDGADSEAVVIRDIFTLSPEDALDRAIDSVLAGFQQDFPVVQDGRLVGMLTREDLLRGLNSSGRTGRVGDAMRTNFPTVSEEEGIEVAFNRLQSAGLRTIPVLSNGSLSGVITTENIAEYLMVRTALRGKGG
jgi:Zn-dependent protease/CBS domain-containing protein